MLLNEFIYSMNIIFVAAGNGELFTGKGLLKLMLAYQHSVDASVDRSTTQLINCP